MERLTHRSKIYILINLVASEKSNLPKLSPNANLHQENRKRKGGTNDDDDDDLDKLLYGQDSKKEPKEVHKIILPPELKKGTGKKQGFGIKKKKVIEDDEDDDDDDVFSTNIDDGKFKF